MNSNDLMVFLRVAEEESITKAAQHLGYVPSNITARIHQLEGDIGTTLFYRHSRGVTLTSEGKILVRYARKIRRLLHDAQAALTSSGMPQGTLTIGSMETTAAVRLPKVLATYHRDYPQIDMSLVTGPTAFLVEQVLNYKLDGAFISGPINQPNLEYDKVFHEELVLVSQPSQTDVKNALTRPILVFPAGCSYRFRLEQWLHSEGIPSPKIMEFGTIEAILGSIGAGLGVSLLPRSVIAKAEEQGAVRSFPIPEHFGIVETVFTYRKETLSSKAFSAFFRLLDSNIRKEPGKLHGGPCQ